jgi:dihydroxyacetone kinase
MYITSLDMAGIMIALVVSTTLVITTAIRNASMHKEIVRLRRLSRTQR